MNCLLNALAMSLGLMCVLSLKDFGLVCAYEVGDFFV